jgi:hypothetical protein
LYTLALGFNTEYVSVQWYCTEVALFLILCNLQISVL